MNDERARGEAHAALGQQLRRLTRERMAGERGRWITGEEPPPDPDSWLAFLGIGGSPINMVTQVRPTGGFVINLPGAMLHVDPGPGAIVWANRVGIDLTRLDAIYISHGHTDHFGGAAPVIEAMCGLMMRRRGAVIAPPSVFARGLISDYHRGEADDPGIYRGGPAIVAAVAGEPIRLGEATLTPHPAYHGGENLGFVLEWPGHRIGYTSDTAYITSYRDRAGGLREPVSRGGGELVELADIVTVHETLRRAYRDVDVLIANVGFFDLFAHRHISAVGLAHLLRGSAVRQCWLTHLGTPYFEPDDRTAELAAWLSAESGVACLVPEIGRRYSPGA